MTTQPLWGETVTGLAPAGALPLWAAHPADVQYLAGHSDPRTTQLYNRVKRKVTRNIVERIRIGR